MPIYEQGFLGKEIEVYREAIRQKYQDQFEYFKEFNKFLHNLKLRITPRDNRGKTIALLFTKASETFQAIYILCERGLPADAEILNRALYETTVNLLYCSIDDECCKNYIAGCLSDRIKWCNSAIANPDEFPKGFVEKARAELPILTRMISDYLKTNDEELINPGELPRWNPPSLLEMARRTGLVNLYQTFYRLVCETTHSDLSSLERYMQLDREGKFKVILWGPRDEDIDVQLITAIEFMEYVCKGLHGLYGEPQKEEIINLHKRKTEVLKGREPF